MEQTTGVSGGPEHHGGLRLRQRRDAAGVRRRRAGTAGESAPGERTRGSFPKRAFVTGLEAGIRVTCPGGQTTTQFTREGAGGQVFHFGRALPTAARCGHMHRRRRRAARCRCIPRRRCCGRRGPPNKPRRAGNAAGPRGGGTSAGAVGQLGVGQARYRGRQKSRLPTAGAGDDCQPALDLELGATAGGSGRQRPGWRGPGPPQWPESRYPIGWGAFSAVWWAICGANYVRRCRGATWLQSRSSRSKRLRGGTRGRFSAALLGCC